MLVSALWHAHTGLQLCPLQGEAYLYLARLCFLEGGDASTKAAYVTQALRLRPYDGEMLFEAGKEALLAGDPTEAQAHWKRCFHAGGFSRIKLVKLLAGHVSLMQLVHSYEPNLSDAQLLYQQYRAIASPAELREFCRWYEQLARQRVEHESPNPLASDPLANTWRFASQMRLELKDHDQSIINARLACQYDPNEYKNHFALVIAALDGRQFEEARTELNWCRQRKPNDKQLQRLFKKAIAGGGALNTTAAAASNSGNDARRQ